MKLLIFVLLVFFISSCNKKLGEAPEISSQRASKVILSQCIDCHQEYSKLRDIDFISKGYIVPGEPEHSLLFAVLKGSNTGAQESMPPKTTLSGDDLTAISEWIKNIDKSQLPSLNSNVLSKVEASNKLTDLEMYYRCYGQFVRQRPAPNDPLLEKIHQNNFTGIQACAELINQVTIDNNGIISSDIGKEILRTFQAFHRSFFSELNLYNNDEQWGNFEIYDPGNLAASFSYSLFKNDEKFSNIFKGTITHELVRKSSTSPKYYVFPFQERSPDPIKLDQFKFGSGKEIVEDQYPTWNINRISTGDIVGVRKIPENRDVIPRVVDTRKGLRDVRGQKEYLVNQDIRKGHGGGILGNPMYLLLNLKMEIGESSDGGKNVPRKWSTAVFKDLFCRNLPVVQLKHAKKYVIENSNLSFRSKANCVQCHVSMDGAAGLVRDFQINYSVDSGLGSYTQTTHLRRNPSTLQWDEKYFGEGDKDFHLRPAIGLFSYQSTDHIYYEKQIESLDEFGSFISKQPDLYRCMVKRYVYFLTGINVDLENDLIDTDFHQYMTKLIRDLASNFQKHQSMKQLLIEIMGTPLYQDRLYLSYLSSSASAEGKKEKYEHQ